MNFWLVKVTCNEEASFATSKRGLDERKLANWLFVFFN